jgi:SPOR domain
MRHALAVRVAEPGETECGLNHVGEAFAGRHLNANAGVMAVARVPPVVPHAGLNNRRFALAEDGRQPGEFHGQFTPEHGEALDESGMAVLANDLCSDKRCQLGSRTAFVILVGQFEDCSPLTGDRVLPDFTDRKLITAHIKQAAFRGTTPVIYQQHQSLASAEGLKTDIADPIRPLIVKTLTVQTEQQQVSMSPLLSGAAPITSSNVSEPSAQVAARWPSTSEVFAPVVPIPARKPLAQTTPEISERAQGEPGKAESGPRFRPDTLGRWSIQIGAFDHEDEAKRHISAARHKLRAILASAESVSERVQKVKKAVYRARFIGLDKASAETACKRLRQSEFECIALEN